MGDFSNLDRIIGYQPIYSTAEFRSSQARALISRFGLKIEEIPELRKRFHDLNNKDALELRVAVSEITPQTTARMFAAEAVMCYEMGKRRANVKLVIPRMTDVVTESYDHTNGTTNADITMNASLAKIYEKMIANLKV